MQFTYPVGPYYHTQHSCGLVILIWERYSESKAYLPVCFTFHFIILSPHESFWSRAAVDHLLNKLSSIPHTEFIASEPRSNGLLSPALPVNSRHICSSTSAPSQALQVEPSRHHSSCWEQPCLTALEF